MAVLRYATMAPVGREAAYDAALDPQALAGSGLAPPPGGWGDAERAVLRCERPAPAAHRKPRPVRVRVLARHRPREIVAVVSERRRWSVTYRETFAATGAGTLITAEMAWGAPLSAVLFELGGRSAGLAAMRRRLDSVTALALARTPLVVGAAVLRAEPVAEPAVGPVVVGQVLAGRVATGEWELPGGKVEPGERPVDAIVREIGEELGVVIDVDGVIADDLPIPGQARRLRAYAARLAHGTPRPLVHTELRWVGADDLAELPWRPADRLLLPHLRARLRAAGPC